MGSRTLLSKCDDTTDNLKRVTSAVFTTMPLTRKMAAEHTKNEAKKQVEVPFYDAINNEREVHHNECEDHQHELKSIGDANPVDGVNQSVALHPYDVGRLIPEYSEGDGVSKWLRRIDHFRVIYGWSEQIYLLYASTRLTGAAANWYRRQEELIFNWRQFKERITIAFPETYDEADIHHELEAVKIEKGESYESYVYRVDAIAQKGDFSTSATLKYIIKGLRHDQVYSHILAKQYTSTLEFLRHIKWIASNMQMLPPAVPRLSKTNTVLPALAADIMCFSCREPGHKSIDCPKPQRKERCNRCLRVGHKSHDCQVRETTLREIQPATFNKPDVMKRTVTNAIFDGNDLGCQLTVNQASQQEVDVDAAGERIQAMALFDTGSYTNLIKIGLLPKCLLLRAATEEVVGINSSKVQILGDFSTILFVLNKAFRVRFLLGYHFGKKFFDRESY